MSKPHLKLTNNARRQFHYNSSPHQLRINAFVYKHLKSITQLYNNALSERDFISTTAQITGQPMSKVRTQLNLYRMQENTPVHQPLDYIKDGQTRRFAMDYCIKYKKMPCILEILEYLNMPAEDHWKLKFHLERTELAGRSQKTCPHQLKIAFGRTKYFRDIVKYRKEERDIIYVNLSRTDQLALLHSARNKGPVEGAFFTIRSQFPYCEYLTEVNFEKMLVYFKEYLLPNISRRSVIVVSDAIAAALELDEEVTITWTKKELQDWLSLHNVDFDMDMSKCSLLDLIEKYQKGQREELINLLEDNEHELLRIPPHHRDLSLLEYVWTDMKRLLYTMEIVPNPGKRPELLKYIYMQFKAEDWQGFEKKMKSVEKEYIKLDTNFIAALKEIITTPKRRNKRGRTQDT